MTTNERSAVATLCLMAAFADGRKDERERARLRDVFASLDAGFSPERTERVLFGHASLNDEAARLTTPAVRALAYEMAVGICDADGRADAAEQAFLDRLRHALGLDTATAAEIDAVGNALALPTGDAAKMTAVSTDLETLAVGDGASSGVPALAASEATSPAPPSAAADAGLDAMILRYAVLNGGLELLPQKIATLAVIPMQTKMVYRVGLHYGHQLDQGHAKELLATVGLGLTSQVAETYARGLFGGLAQATLGKAMGGSKKGKKKNKKANKVAAIAAGSAFTFAATYALGHAAKAYYSGGRQLSTDALRGLFERQLEQGRSLYQTHQPAVEERARTTDLRALMAELRPA